MFNSFCVFKSKTKYFLIQPKPPLVEDLLNKGLFHMHARYFSNQPLNCTQYAHFMALPKNVHGRKDILRDLRIHCGFCADAIEVGWLSP